MTIEEKRKLKELFSITHVRNLILENKYKELYDYLNDIGLIGLMSYFLMYECNIPVLNYMNAIPRFFMYGVEYIRDFDIPHGIKAIEAYSFSETNIENISIPKSVTYIGGSAFFDSPLLNVYYEGSEEDWNKINIIDANKELRMAKIHYNSY